MAVDSLKILIVDDEANIRKTLSFCLENSGHKVVAVSNFQDALMEASRQVFELAFVDLRLGTASGMDLIPALRAVTPWIKIIVITAYSSIESAVEAMRRGAADYLPKPFTPAQVELAARKILEIRNLEQRIERLQHDLERLRPEIELSSESHSMQKAIALARQVAPTNATVLLRGESGTGKSLFARAIHAWSTRSQKPFGIVSCPSLSKELLESELFGHVKGAFTGAVRNNPGRIAACEGGTLFLDEIGEIPPAIQPKLLRFLQDREYEHVGDPATHKADVRILAATNADLDRAVQEERFRQDLFYRLNVIQIAIPPLREHPEDIVPLAERFLLFFGRQRHHTFVGFTDEARDTLKRYPWPGNVRELQNAMERAAILCQADRVGVEFLPDSPRPAPPIPGIGDPVSVEKIEELHIRSVLASSKSLQEAAETLGLDQATLWRRRKKYGI